MISNRTKYNRGEVQDVIVVIVGIVLVLVALGIFRRPIPDQVVREINTSTSEWYSGSDSNGNQFSDSECGLQLIAPAKNQSLASVFEIWGLANGCGWVASNGVVGYAQVHDGLGRIVSNPEPLVVDSAPGALPVEFRQNITLTAIPSGTSGILAIYSIPPQGGSPEVIRIPIKFKK